MDIDKDLAMLAKQAGGPGIAFLSVSVGESACGPSIALSISFPKGRTMQFTGHDTSSVLNQARRAIEAMSHTADIIQLDAWGSVDS